MRPALDRQPITPAEVLARLGEVTVISYRMESKHVAEVKLGLDAVLTIDGAEIKNCKDLTVTWKRRKPMQSLATTTAGERPSAR